MRSHRPGRLRQILKQPRNQGSVDYLLVGVIFFIVIFGLAMLSSASSVESFRRFGSTYHLFTRQVLLGLLPGLVLFFFFSRFHYEKWKRHTLWILIGTVGLLLLVFVPGVGADYGKAHSWINVLGISFQPSEVAKLGLILVLSDWLSQRGREMNRQFKNGFIPFIVILGFFAIPVVLQPDIGTLSIMIAIGFTIYFVAGASWRHVLMLLGFGAIALLALIKAAPYRMARLLVFLNPSADPQGAGYHINQALLAVGSGGLFGVGFGQSRQKFAYLPEVMGDSIFAVIAEEIGFMFSVLLIIAFIVLIMRSLKIASELSDEHGRLLVVGIASWFGLQAFVNIGAMVGLLPLTGIPLTFVSYGATALAMNLAAAGILVNVSRRLKG